MTPIVAMDPDGKQTTLVPQVQTVVRVHRLGQNGRVALLTVVSHSNQGVGERGTIKLDLKAPLEVDTSRSGNLAVLEVRRR